ncbi:hypothetical protein WD019_00650 [Fictibacillus sp. Mic-4]|uniref:hypothetical protein n=1 Tax=Fictibacillus sp. Mic-4 TaxID=3132826 RepID=UPI003CEF19DC
MRKPKKQNSLSNDHLTEFSQKINSFASTITKENVAEKKQQLQGLISEFNHIVNELIQANQKVSQEKTKK